MLEVSAGTGRNLPYYPLSRLSSLTLTDASPCMLAAAYDKHRAQQRRRAADPATPPVRFLLADAQHMLAAPSSSSGSEGAAAAAAPGEPVGGGGGGFVRPELQRAQRFAPASFDTVVDTFGLCSHEDPVRVLQVRRGGGVESVLTVALLASTPPPPHPCSAQEMARVCKPGGRILLLEHGRGTWGWVNDILERQAPEHYAKWGCWWNRDIEALVRDAGLRVESQRRWHFGTTHVTVARPPAVVVVQQQQQQQQQRAEGAV